MLINHSGEATEQSGPPCLDNAEIIKEIHAILSSRDWTRLYWSSYRRLYWVQGANRVYLAADLQHEAVVRILRTRPVPVDVAVIAALFQAVRSVAGCWRTANRRVLPLEAARQEIIQW